MSTVGEWWMWLLFVLFIVLTICIVLSIYKARALKKLSRPSQASFDKAV